MKVNTEEFIVGIDGSDYNRAKEVREFDETKAGVKGLVDAGVVKIPRFFHHPRPNNDSSGTGTGTGVQFQIPVIDLAGIGSSCWRRRAEIVNEIREASESWGFFQILNHGIPSSVMDEMLQGVRRFHEQPKEEKMKLYSRDRKQRVRYCSNGDLLISKAANWRDTFSCQFQDGELDFHDLPPACRVAISDYMKSMIELRETLSELLSEALGLSSDYIARTECMKSESLACHYYPPCPEPELTIGTSKHSDPSFITVLLQDNLGGLQVLYQDQWVDVVPVQGALIANIGDLMQLISNNKFKGVEHRVLAQKMGPRVSAACLFLPSTIYKSKPYGPIKEFLSDHNPPIYREILIREYFDHCRSKGLDVGGESIYKQKPQTRDSKERFQMAHKGGYMHAANIVLIC